MEMMEGKQAVYAKTRVEWRNWLKKNNLVEKSVWLILFHKKSNMKSVKTEEAMEEALCFGWIDSKAKKRDTESFYLTFTPRRPKSNWSTINKERAGRLIKNGLMTEMGQCLIDQAKMEGKWN